MSLKCNIRVLSLRRNLLSCIFIFYLLPLPSLQSENCPLDGLIVLRPEDPFIFVGNTSRLCCLALDRETRLPLQHQPSVDMVFSCHHSVIISPIPNGPGESSYTACANVTVTNINQFGFCNCHVVNQSSCQASQYLTTEHPLPSSFNFSCLTHGSENVTCSLHRLPTFSHPEKVQASISWRQIVPGVNSNPVTHSKVCSSHNSCILRPRDGVIFGLPLRFNISITLKYDGLKDCDVSQWIEYDITSKVKLPPLKVSIVGVSRTSITIKWDRQYMARGDKIVHIDYTASDNGWESHTTNIVTEKMLFISDPVETVLAHLRPSTSYLISLKTRTKNSSVWSDYTSLSATTTD